MNPILTSNAPVAASTTASTAAAASTTAGSTPFSLSDRLVWVRPSDAAAATATTDDVMVTWVPALHYRSHTELLQHHPDAIATVGRYGDQYRV